MTAKKSTWRHQFVVLPVTVAAGGFGWLIGGPGFALLFCLATGLVMLLNSFIRSSQEQCYGSEGSAPETWSLYH